MLKRLIKHVVICLTLAIAFDAYVLAQTCKLCAHDSAQARKLLLSAEAEAFRITRQKLGGAMTRSPTYVEERIADAEAFLNLKDYERTRIITASVMDKYPTHRAIPEAVYLMAEAYFREKDYLAAQRYYEQIVEHSREAGYSAYFSQALSRMLEIAARTRRFEMVEPYFARIDSLSGAREEGAIDYYRARFHYAKANVLVSDVSTDLLKQGDNKMSVSANPAELDTAIRFFSQVGTSSPFYARSQYFIGVAYVLRKDLGKAMATFDKIVNIKKKKLSEEEQMVRELAVLATGRIYFEQGAYAKALKAYDGINQLSPRYDAALYEQAWVHIRTGDAENADRTLEVLTVASPQSVYVPEVRVLRGELLLRIGRYQESNKAFDQAEKLNEPIANELKQIADDQSNTQQYFSKLVDQYMSELDPKAILPPAARKWVVEDDSLDPAVAVASQVIDTRRLVKETNDLVARIEAIIGAADHVAVYEDANDQRRETAALRNKLAKVRKWLIDDISMNHPSPTNPEIMKLRAERERLEPYIEKLIDDPDKFRKKDSPLIEAYTAKKRLLANVEVEITGLDARLAAFEQVLASSRITKLDAKSREGVKNEIAMQREGAKQYREELQTIRRQLEIAKMQIGVGDARYANDKDLRERYIAVVNAERQALVINEHEAAFAQIERLERMAEAHDRMIETTVEQRVAELRRVVDDEKINLAGYQQALTNEESQSAVAVGQTVQGYLARLRNTFQGLVLRSDAGKTDVAWAKREEHRLRADLLSRERARELQVMDDEYSEITDAHENKSKSSEVGQ